MQVKASVKNAIITPRKTRLVVDLVRGKSVNDAINILNFTPRKSAGIVKKLIESAAANASHNFGLPADNLYVKTIEAQEGLVIKRWMPRAHGHATKILKRRSHITVCLEELEKTNKIKMGRKSKMKTFSYEEVKKAVKEAEKASKMVQKKQEGKGGKMPQKEIGNRPLSESHQSHQMASRPKFSRLGDRFKSLIHRTTKKG